MKPMTEMDALKHLRTLVNVASESDDIDAVHKVLREMRGVINNILPTAPRPRPKRVVHKANVIQLRK
jgi:hypothetical protein